MPVTWKGRLVWNDEQRAYIGVVSIAGFPYDIRVERDWSSDQKAVLAAVSVSEGPKR